MRHRTKPITLILVGCGRIAESHLAVIQDLPECRLAAVVDVRPEAAAAFADRARCRAYADAGEALARERPEAAILCTPPFTHAELAIGLLDSGVHVLCEKPLAISLKDAEAMVDAAGRGDAVLMMASKFRYVGDIVKARGIIEAGLLGEIILYENVFCGRVDMRDRWNAQRALSGGGVLIDNGSHAVDIARYLLGAVTQVQVQEGKNVQGLEVEDSVQVYFRTATGVMGALNLSWSIPKELDAYLNLYGTEGILSVGWQSSRYRQSEKLHWVTFGEGYRKHDAMKRQMRNFIDVINGVDRPVITETDALESVRVIETAYRSLAINKWLTVEDADAVAR